MPPFASEAPSNVDSIKIGSLADDDSAIGYILVSRIVPNMIFAILVLGTFSAGWSRWALNDEAL